MSYLSKLKCQKQPEKPVGATLCVNRKHCEQSAVLTSSCVFHVIDILLHLHSEDFMPNTFLHEILIQILLTVQYKYFVF